MNRALTPLLKKPNVCFEFDLITEPKESEEPCSWGMKYQSAIGFGKAIFIEELDEKRKAMDIIMAQYTDQQFEFAEDKVKGTAVFKVEIGSMTGRPNPDDVAKAKAFARKVLA